MQAQSKHRSEEHKRKISLALQKKWAEPGYRDRVLGGMRTEVTQTNRVSAYKVGTTSHVIGSLKSGCM